MKNNSEYSCDTSFFNSMTGKNSGKYNMMTRIKAGPLCVLSYNSQGDLKAIKVIVIDKKKKIGSASEQLQKTHPEILEHPTVIKSFMFLKYQPQKRVLRLGIIHRIR